MHELLREYVSLVVERVKSKRGKHARGGGHFDLRQFKTLESSHIMLDYAGRYLQELGRGSARAAFALTNRSILKIALDQKGIAQNQTELDVYTDQKTKPIVAKVLDVDDENRWMISELVKPLRAEDEFENLTGISFDDLDGALAAAYKRLPTPEHVKKSPIILAVVALMNDKSLLPGDLTKIDSWGQTADGRAVLLDYGFTSDVWEKHYKKRQIATVPKTPNPRVKVEPERPVDDDDGPRTQNLAAKRPQTRTLKAA